MSEHLLAENWGENNVCPFFFFFLLMLTLSQITKILNATNVVLPNGRAPIPKVIFEVIVCTVCTFSKNPVTYSRCFCCCCQSKKTRTAKYSIFVEEFDYPQGWKTWCHYAGLRVMGYHWLDNDIPSILSNGAKRLAISDPMITPRYLPTRSAYQLVNITTRTSRSLY